MLNISSFRFKYKFEKTKIEFWDRNETEIAHHRSKQKLNKIGKIPYSLLLITVVREY